MVGRLLLGPAVLLWRHPVAPDSGTLWQYLQAMLAYAVPPVVALVLTGIFWRGANAVGAAATLALGTACGIALFIANVPLHLLHLHFLYVAPTPSEPGHGDPGRYISTCGGRAPVSTDRLRTGLDPRALPRGDGAAAVRCAVAQLPGAGGSAAHPDSRRGRCLQVIHSWAPAPTATHARSALDTDSSLNVRAAAAIRVSACASGIGGLVSPFLILWKRTGLIRATT